MLVGDGLPDRERVPAVACAWPRDILFKPTGDIRHLQAVARGKETLARNAGVRGNGGGDLNDYFGWAVDAIACTNKHQAFQIKGEYRLLLSDVRYRENNIRLRTVRSTLVPYVELRIPGRAATGLSFDKRSGWSAIDSVAIGPTANMDLALKGMQVKVVSSKIPYRDW
jgi:hypothetical protein